MHNLRLQLADCCISLYGIKESIIVLAVLCMMLIRVHLSGMVVAAFNNVIAPLFELHIVRMMIRMIFLA